MIHLIQVDPKAEQRTRLALQEVAGVLNGLIRGGVITAGGSGGGASFGVKGIWFVGHGTPPAIITGSVPGDFYFNLDTGKLYELF